ncbi:MAG: TIGR03560 family F420-dependent LLM class oxidoreductase [Acidimicrobiia bacterium]|nr:TIGR03560 family F420-dependent LLM class oxidoreductase [Acidimicrobiia bacterium]
MHFSFWATSGNSWDDILAGCHHAETTGWDGVWVPDHFMPPPGGYGEGLGSSDGSELGPVHEAWVLLGALAAVVPRVRVGAMVSGITYRHPAVLANMVATLDHVSGGRAVLGIGAGWQENEHQRYGLALGSPAERSDRFEEACEVIVGLLTDRRTTFAGRYYQLDGAPMEPKPLQDPLPVVIGGAGEQRTLRTVARWANESNVWGGPDVQREKGEVLARHCDDVGRDVGEIRRTAAAMLTITDDEATADRISAPMAHRGALVGTIDQLRRRLDEFADAGIDELVVPDFNLAPGEREVMLDRFMEEVVGR